MSKDELSRQAIFDFNQFISGLASSQMPLLNYKQVTREEAVDLFLRVREDLLPYRQDILDSARQPKYIFSNDKWCRVLVSVGGEIL